MARLQLDPSAMVRTHALNREERAQRAFDTVNKVIPAMLRSSPRARHSIYQSVLITDPEEPAHATQSSNKLRIRVRETDTFSAARQMTYSSRRASVSARDQSPKRKTPNVCVLNQASAIKPGGGFLDGVHSQEEFLCQRSTLIATLGDQFYPLPEVGGVFSPDVLVFADSTPEAEELPKRDRIYIDAISASTIKFPGAPKFKQHPDGAEETRPPCSCGVSYCDQDRAAVSAKMNAVLRIADSKGVERLILGAWGCGAYGNPPREVARLWKKAICGTARAPATWSKLKDITFAIPDRVVLREFERCFAEELASSAASEIHQRTPPRGLDDDSDDAAPPEDDRVQALIAAIQDAELQLSRLQNPRSRGRLRDKLTNLNRQLAELGTGADSGPVSDPDDSDESDDGFVVQGYPGSDADAAEDKDRGYYAFDEHDDPSSDSDTLASSYEFRFSPPRAHVQRAVSPSPAAQMGFVHAVPDSPAKSHGLRDVEERRRVDEQGGWFAGSVGELSALLRKTGTGSGPIGLNPALSPVETRHDVFDM